MIQAVGLTKAYGRTTAVDDLTFDVHPGVVTGFLGPNGAGKSTTMRLLMGLEAPDAGKALIDGRPYHALNWPLRQVGAHLDAKAFHPGLTAEQHLRALARANAIDRSRVAVVLEQVGLSPVGRRRVGTFSLGMAQRLGIAAALLGDPGNLLFDEPMNGLDPEGIHWIRTFLRALAAEGRAILLSSHLIAEMALTADRLVVVGRGRVVAQLSSRELAARAPRSVRVRAEDQAGLAAVLLGAAMTVSTGPDGSLSVTGSEPAAIAALAARAGVQLHELTPERASLEEVFLELTDASTDYRAVAAAGAARNGASPTRRTP
ncbi:MAG TPA: ATP-binding cassette domain-containing protein [Actinomycetota bacterium]|nr:ATP-binding cassette domain-containing protein [Actinomycetota bacterium]